MEPKYSKGEIVNFHGKTAKILDFAQAIHLDTFSYSLISDDGIVDFAFEKDIDKVK